MNKTNYMYGDITEKIIGCAMKVHNKLGAGFQEVIYQRALAIEMNKIGLNFQRELEMDIHYDNEIIGTRRTDFLVEEKIIVELKAIKELDESHWAQTINYLKVYGYEIGLLLNFGGKKLEFRRFIHTHKTLSRV